MRVPYVAQMEAADCGAACLAMVLGLHGRTVSLDDARRATGSGRGGISAADLMEAGRAFGLVGRGVTLEIDEVRLLPRGAILHWSFDHFVVYEAATRAGVRVVDPAAGPRFLTWARFREEFTGVALTFEPGEGFARGGARRRTLAGYFARLLAHRGLLARVVVLSVLAQVFALGLPVLLGIVVDRVVPRGDAGLLGVLAAGLGAVVVFQVAALVLRGLSLIYLRSVLDAGLSVGFMDQLAELPLAFFLARPAGDLLARYDSNRSLRHTLTAATLSSLLDGAFVLFYLVLLVAYSPWLAALVVLLGALQVLSFVAFGTRYRERMSAELEAEARTEAHLVDMLSGIETLKASGSETRFLERWTHLFVRELNASVLRNRLGAVAGAVTSGLSILSPLAVVTLGAWQVLEGRLTLGTMLAMNAVAAGFLTPLSSLMTTAMSLQEARSHIARVDDVMHAPREQDRSRVRAASALAGRIDLEDVRFAYGEREGWSLERVSLSVTPGSKVAIVGKSGAGKSTLARILVGLYAPTAGRVLFDGLDLRDLDARSVRRQIGVVTQDARIFGTTVRDNIALGDPSIGSDAVEEAARLAAIHDEILELPMGYATPLSPGGASLSGGQRQRLAIARALACRPAIVLLDEATSDLDTVNETAVTRNLAALACTRIVIAHRLSTVSDADVIVVLDRGRVVETGRHGELIARQGVYAELVASQVSL